MNTTIPVSLSAMQSNTGAPARPTSPADAVTDAGRAMVEAYNAYQDLRALTGQLNGLSDSAPIPENLKFDEIVIRFRVNNEPKVARLSSVQRVGDLARLLTLESERLINVMRTQAAQAQSNAAAIEAACSRAQYVTSAQQGYGPE